MIDITTLRVAATVACFIVFIGIVVWACSRRNTQAFEEAARLPFERD
ncbi:cbb3-type cytochrome oxidase subunit 3 [Variovorax ginsengisoli]|uniref:Cytochrome c oxidase cbb3-type subunit 4 n=1 Tax=Variovorax ginsengisoli TaxID=363844 RepID=A0ABT9S5T5_9BURK|nr:cbb3-type cytochrome c oxidase subunit 3 [Variovorax ginsengisoli]MDP9898697.1 cytochrome c oxidase cbb3-type subunit 4 [Variovorax ginsengisoli]